MTSSTTGTAAAFGTAATIGKRDIQEDSIGWSRDRFDLKGELPALTIIADGMGGHAAGEVASKIAVDGFLDAYRRDVPGGATVLIDSLDWANGQIAGHVAANPETDGMGCTLIAVEINADSTAYRWISVGDSLLLSVTPAGIDRLNADHSYREERERLAAAGESLDGAPAANVLRSALMGFDVPLIDNQTEWRAFAPGETLILATDGLETLSPDRVLDIARSHAGATDVADALIASVNASNKPRQDNTSVAVIRPPALHMFDVAGPTQPPVAIPTATGPAATRESAEPRTMPAATISPADATLPPKPLAEGSTRAEEARTLPPAPAPLPIPAHAAAANAGAPAAKPLPRKSGTTRSAQVALALLFGVVLGVVGGWAATARFGHLLPPALQPATVAGVAAAPVRSPVPRAPARNTAPAPPPAETPVATPASAASPKPPATTPGAAAAPTPQAPPPGQP